MKFIISFVYMTFCVIFLACVYCVVMGVGSFPSALTIGIVMFIVIILAWEDVMKLAKGIR